MPSLWSSAAAALALLAAASAAATAAEVVSAKEFSLSPFFALLMFPRSCEGSLECLWGATVSFLASEVAAERPKVDAVAAAAAAAAAVEVVAGCESNSDSLSFAAASAFSPSFLSTAVANKTRATPAKRMRSKDRQRFLFWWWKERERERTRGWRVREGGAKERKKKLCVVPLFFRSLFYLLEENCVVEDEETGPRMGRTDGEGERRGIFPGLRVFFFSYCDIEAKILFFSIFRRKKKIDPHLKKKKKVQATLAGNTIAPDSRIFFASSDASEHVCVEAPSTALKKGQPFLFLIPEPRAILVSKSSFDLRAK